MSWLPDHLSLSAKDCRRLLKADRKAQRRAHALELARAFAWRDPFFRRTAYAHIDDVFVTPHGNFDVRELLDIGGLG